ncbi:LTA synthase family protein [Labilibacter sediminis]|nr:LTA synthase family protein [Labilibacter sediminis]
MKSIFFPKRFALLKSFSLTYLLLSTIIRVTLYVMSFSYMDFSMLNTLEIIGIGFLFDIGSLSYIIAFYAIYLLIIPSRLHGSKFDKTITNVAFGLIVFVMVFAFLAEIPFWNEYQRRFNFIAIDYLLYTYEVVQNINESFPIPLLVGIMLIITIAIIVIAKRRNVFGECYSKHTKLKSRLIPTFICISIFAIYHFNIKNVQAEVFTNVNENELAKSGLYSFFAAYKSNELNYSEFYDTIPNAQLFPKIKNIVSASNDSLYHTDNCITRYVHNPGMEQTPNVIFIGLESMSASFLKRYGNKNQLTPTLDSILKQSVSFTNMYATGTRTIRGLEALTLCIPPTPGRSIVKRDYNKNLFTIGEVFKQKGYSRTFICGGDGLFDNMANYFGHNGFDVVDRMKSFRDQDSIPTQRTQITDDQVTFENAWGACDGDIYNVMLAKADEDYKKDQPFFYLMMTNSNHPPYTYPDGVINATSGNARKRAIAYADKTFKDFFATAKDKPWFKNTVFVIAADHCAYSAGRKELDIKKHHIPACIYNLNEQEPVEVDKLASQIDIFPTLFGYLNWSYTTNLFGKDISKMTKDEERTFIANHRKLGLLKNNQLMILETPQKHICYKWDSTNCKMSNVKGDTLFIQEAVAYYQSAYELYKNGGLSIVE